MSKQFSEEKGDNMSSLSATVCGLSVNVPVGIVRRALALAEVSGSDTGEISISLERLVILAQIGRFGGTTAGSREDVVLCGTWCWI